MHSNFPVSRFGFNFVYMQYVIFFIKYRVVFFFLNQKHCILSKIYSNCIILLETCKSALDVDVFLLTHCAIAAFVTFSLVCLQGF